MSSFALTQLDISVADDETLAALVVSAGGAGLVMGVSGDGRPLVLQMFGREPADYALVSGMRLRKIISFRALALGARVFIHTQRPEAWEAFVRVAGGVRGDIQCVPPGSPVPPGKPDQPVLVLLDSIAGLGGNARPAGRWSAVISATDHANRWNLDDLKRVDLVFAQSLPASAASVVGPAFAISNASQLSGLADDHYTIVSKGSVEVVNLRATAMENWVAGQR